jgi:tRNA A-37 threonylcarbamoyl transferase component Bud32/tetratricopeptide (TPR) repeat protein
VIILQPTVTDQDLATEARRARERGELGRAKQLFERMWDFRAAAECAREAGDRPEALRLLLEAQALPEAAQMAAALGPDPTELDRAAAVYEHKRMWANAAALRERMGAFARAAELWGRAHARLARARALELAGDLRAAGQAYERLLVDTPEGAEAAEARRSLAHLLAAFGRHEEAVRQLQRSLAQQASLSAPEAEPLPREHPCAEGERVPREAADFALLVRELDALSLRDAARHALERLRRLRPETPASLDEFLAHETPAAPSTDGRSLAGRYRVLRLLAAGGTGRVYLAEDALLGGEVAIKLFAASSDARARDAWQRFLREARIVRQLRHPNLVAVRDVDETLGMLVMEFLPGGTLADRLAQTRRLSPAAALRVTLEVLAALEAAHQRGIIHRDLKPANILFDAAGSAKLGDFGVAHLVDAGQTQTGGLIGTLAYMSPEQVTGAPITFAADLYALGVTLFEMLAGALPFGGPDFVAQHLAEPVPSTGLGTAFDEVVRRLMEKAPDGRYRSIDEARRALAALPSAPPDAAWARPVATPTGNDPPSAHAAPRYRDLQPQSTTAWSRLGRAIDTRLDRGVLLEEHTEPLEPHLGWLHALARAGGPHVQRLLQIDVAARLVVWELPAGVLLDEAALEPAQAARALVGVASALDALHAQGIAHGALSARAVVVDDGGALVLLAGLCAPGVAPDPGADLAAAASLASGLGLAPLVAASAAELVGAARLRAQHEADSGCGRVRALVVLARARGLPAPAVAELARAEGRRLGLDETAVLACLA